MPTAPSLPAAAVADYIEKQAKLMHSLSAKVRKENVDALHDMRVASRRLRVAVREAKPLLEEALYEEIQERLESVTEALGHARELDVMALMMVEYSQDAYGPWKRAADHAIAEIQKIRKETTHEAVKAVEAVDSPDFEKAVARAAAALRKDKKSALAEIGPGLKRRLKQLRETYRDWRETEAPADLHRTRIAFKKLRYAAEFYAPAYDKQMAKLIDEFKDAQEYLGDWHDGLVLADALRRIEQHAPYREVQGFPLIIEAFKTFSDTKTQEFQHWAKAFFSGEGRKHAADYFSGDSRA